MVSDDDILDYLQLINTENIGHKTFFQLLDKFGSVKEALQNLPPRYTLYDRTKAKEELSLAKHLGVKILTSHSPEYPQSLLSIEDYPPILYARGHTELLNNHLCLAMVGARNASINGRKLAAQIAYDLTQQGIVIVSGMARGIDSSSHKGAMHANQKQGPTIAVLGTGIDIPYPSENKELYEQICQQGCLISEFPLGTSPQPHNFPRRNRIISGLSSAVLVAEANLHSGSLITAYTAAEQGRDVMAVPGSPLDGRSKGTNKLIKEGAYLVEDAGDILDILQNNYTQTRHLEPQQNLFTHPLDNKTKTDNIPQEEKEEETTTSMAVIDFLTPDGVYVDELIEISGLDSATVNAELLYLELEGKITRQAGNKVALIK